MNIPAKLNQTCVYWAAPVADGYGKSTYADPVELACRWNQKNARYLDLTGEMKVAQATVVLLQDVDIGGYLWLGTLVTLPETYENGDPSSLDSARPIKNTVKTASLDASEFVRKAYL